MKKPALIVCLRGMLILGMCFLASAVFAQSLDKDENYKKSVEFAALAQEAMDAADYDKAAEYAIESQKYAALSQQSIEKALAARGQRPPIAVAATPPGGFAAEYEVKNNPARRDCLWRIAGYDFIYGNSSEWKRLYDYNKSTFRNPDNPNLIFPGQILQIPSINGEERTGRK